MVTESGVSCKEVILVLKRKFTLGYAEAAVYRMSQRSPLMISISDVKPITLSAFFSHRPITCQTTVPISFCLSPTSKVANVLLFSSTNATPFSPVIFPRINSLTPIL